MLKQKEMFRGCSYMMCRSNGAPSKAVSGGDDRRPNQKGAKSQHEEHHGIVNDFVKYVKTIYVLSMIVNVVRANTRYRYNAEGSNIREVPEPSA